MRTLTFPEPIITPATHAEEGHDEDITPDENIERGLIPAADYAQLYEKLLGKPFEKSELASTTELTSRIEKNILKSLENLR